MVPAVPGLIDHVYEVAFAAFAVYVPVPLPGHLINVPEGAETWLTFGGTLKVVLPVIDDTTEQLKLVTVTDAVCVPGAKLATV